jgi:hypothetical protein
MLVNVSQLIFRFAKVQSDDNIINQFTNEMVMGINKLALSINIRFLESLIVELLSQ